MIDTPRHGVANICEWTMFCLLMNIVHWFVVLFLVMNKAATVRTCPIALITFIWMFSCMSPSMVNQIIRPLEFLATKITSMAKLCFVDKLMLFERVFQFKCHSTIFTSKISYVGMNFEVNMVSRYLIKCFSTFFTTPLTLYH